MKNVYVLSDLECWFIHESGPFHMFPHQTGQKCTFMMWFEILTPNYV